MGACGGRSLQLAPPVLEFLPGARSLAGLHCLRAFRNRHADQIISRTVIPFLREPIAIPAGLYHLEGRRKRLELPAIDREMLSGLVANFEGVMAEGTNRKTAHLLRRLVNKVLRHDRRTVEVWY